MKSKILIVLLVVLISCAKAENKVCIKGECFNVEIADSAEERSQGLMFRENIDKGDGMLFIFEKEDKYGFWMKNMKFPIDILWINENKSVVYMHKNTPPCPENVCFSIIPDKDAKYVLELNKGVIDELNINLGDGVVFK